MLLDGIIPILAMGSFVFAYFKVTFVNFNRHPLIYTYLERARRELSNDTHIDYVCVYTKNFEKITS